MGMTDEDAEKPSVDVDDDEEFEKRMKAWSDPIAEGAIAYARAEGLDLSVLGPEEYRQELISTLVCGIPVMLSETLATEYLPREMQESDQGRLRFARGTSGVLKTFVDGFEGPLERMCLREGYGLMLRQHGFPGKLAVWITKAAEEAVLGGKAYFLGFAHDAAASTPEEAVYVRAPEPGEIERFREQ